MPEKRPIRSALFRPFILILIFLAAMYYWRRQSESNIPIDHHGTQELFIPGKAPFYHGVASGDPLTDRVIIWTRITPDEHAPQTVGWEMSSDPNFENILQKGEVTTDSAKDYTVKVDVRGLQPDQTYYYRFASGKVFSETGKTRTAPGGDRSVTLAVISCSNYEAGYFNVLRSLSERSDLTAVVHLGDYIYELATGLYGDSTLTDRRHLPPGELITLSDYRTRYAQYRLDPDLQAVHSSHPFIAIWDDHEITNNAYSTGGQNHQENEGDYNIRSEAARRAYYEWLPVREGAELYRNFYLSEQAELIMLDERLAGRVEQVGSKEDPKWSSADQRMLGKEQFQWLLDRLAQSQARWKIIGNQVIFAEVDRTPLYRDNPYNMDAWDGYPEERKRLLDFLKAGKISNVVFVTGDTHSSWAFEIPYYRENGEENGMRLAIEFGTPSISSANTDEYMPADSVKVIERALMSPDLNPNLKYVNLRDHGYLELRLDSLSATATWYYTTTVGKRDAAMFRAASWTSGKDSLSLHPSM